MEYRNETEIWIWHLKRGGGHALVNWIASNAGRPLFHLNNCFSKPFKVRLRKERIFRIISRSLDGRGPRRLYNLELDASTPYRSIAGMHKEILVCSLENVPLDRARTEALYREGGAESILGESRRRLNVMILRDAPNTFASVRKGKRRMRKRLKTFYPVHWADYAREFLGQRQRLPAGTIMISYNRWFSDRDYRHELAGKLGLPTSEEGLNTLSADGGGSSFSGQELRDRARKLNVLERWKHFIEDPVYLGALNSEILELSGEIFGDVTGGVLTPDTLDSLRKAARRHGR